MKNLLILHGWGSSSNNWSGIKKILEKEGINVFAPDLPGFGKNHSLDRSFSIDDFVEWVESYCEENNLSRFFLLGHSFGGAIAVKFLLKNPTKVEKLFLVGPALIRRNSFKKNIIKKFAKFFFFFPTFLKKVIYSRLIRSDYPLTAGQLRKTYLKVIREDVSHLLSKINTPTVIIWGKKDKITPLEDGYLINKEISGSKIKLIDKAGHSIHLETPEKLTEIILKYASFN